jgi:uncharacterized membrane protein
MRRELQGKVRDGSCSDGGLTNMSLYVSPESSWLVRSAAEAILMAHVSGGVVGLLSGATALLVPKGQRLHRIAGNVFFVSMLVASAIGACVSPFLPQPAWGNVAMGVFVFYLVATSWVTIRRNEGSVGSFEIGALLVVVGTAGFAVMLGLRGTRSATSSPGSIFLFATIAALAAAGDLRMILRGGVLGAQRIARHLWRMCFALLIGAISLFLGQPQLFSASVHKSGVLFVPEIAVLGLLIFWLVRVRFTSGLKHGAADRGTLRGHMPDPTHTLRTRGADSVPWQSSSMN